MQRGQHADDGQHTIDRAIADLWPAYAILTRYASSDASGKRPATRNTST